MSSLAAGPDCSLGSSLVNSGSRWRSAFEGSLAVVFVYCALRMVQLARHVRPPNDPEQTSTGRLLPTPQHREIGAVRLRIGRRVQRTSSDIDLLVTFCPRTKIGLMGVTRIELALSPFFGNRKIDLRTISGTQPLHSRQGLARGSFADRSCRASGLGHRPVAALGLYTSFKLKVMWGRCSAEFNQNFQSRSELTH